MHGKFRKSIKSISSIDKNDGSCNEWFGYLFDSIYTGFVFRMQSTLAHKEVNNLLSEFRKVLFHPVLCLLSLPNSVVCKKEIFMKRSLGKNHLIVTSNNLVLRIQRPLFVMIFSIPSEFFFSVSTRYVVARS